MSKQPNQRQRERAFRSSMRRLVSPDAHRWAMPVIALVMLIGIIAGAIWGGIVGFLKARTGAHEVIVTIMLNYVALQALSWLLSTPAFLRPGRVDPIAPVIAETAAFPILFRQLNVGFFVALAAAGAVWWLLDRSTLGFAIRAVGANPAAAGTAGMNVPNVTIITMALSGLLCGLAGVQYALGPGADLVATPLSIGLVGTVGLFGVAQNRGLIRHVGILCWFEPNLRSFPGLINGPRSVHLSHRCRSAASAKGRGG